MKAYELMIGDFVTRQNYENKAVVCKIIGLSKNSISVEFDNGGRSIGASEDSINPIPLTPEILEKNGFKKNGIPNSVASIKEMDWCDDTYVWSRQETPDERLFVSVYMDDPANFFVEVYCQYCHADGIHVKYLHELQHALKLCGINKEIVL